MKRGIRHPTEKRVQNPTPSPPYISIATVDKKIIKYLSENEGKRFNIKEFSRINKLPRTNIYDSLKRLERQGLIKRDLADNKLTEKGKIYVNYVGFRGVGGSRRGCRIRETLSTHYHKFKLLISSKKNFKIEKLKRLKNNGIKENRLANLHQTIIDFDDAKVIINPKQIILSLFEIKTENVEESDRISLSRAVEYAELLRSVGIETEGLMVESGEWARVESILSDWLHEKVDNRYFLNLKDGKKFWIDHSLGKNEDETNSKKVRERVDTFLTQIAENDFDLHDIDKIKESLGFITKLEASRLQDAIEENKKLRIELENKNKLIPRLMDLRGNYIG